MFNLSKSCLMLAILLSSSAFVNAKDQNCTTSTETQREQKNSISLVGVVSGSNSDVNLTHATASIKIGDKTSSPILITAGAFQFDNLPAESEYELVLHSTNNAFTDKKFIGKTRANNSMDQTFQDLGVLKITDGKAPAQVATLRMN